MMPTNMGSTTLSTQQELRPRPVTVTVMLTAVMTAFVFVVTTVLSSPIAGTPGQRFNAGDIAIFVSALTFGPVVGGFAGGVGSALSDAILPGGQVFAPFTLVIKGLEGLVAGYVALVGFRRINWTTGVRDWVAWALGSSIMVAGYFIAESYLIGIFFGASNAPGIASALLELPFNILQVFAGWAVGFPVAHELRSRLPAMLARPSGRGTEKSGPS